MALAGQPLPEWFVNDLSDIVANDLFRSSQMPAHTEMALLDELWSTITSFAVYSEIGHALGVSYEVVSRHIGYLSNGYLLWSCPQKDDNSWTARAGAQVKVYAVDPLIARMVHLRNSERHDIDPTALAEMQLGNAVRRRVFADAKHSPADHALFHVRTPTRKEIDFVSDPLAGVAIEGKYTQGSWKAEAATVDASAWSGILAKRNVLDASGPADRAWAVPAGGLAYLLDT